MSFLRYIFLELEHLFVELGSAYTMVHMWGSDNNLKESVLSFYHVAPRNPTHVIKFGGKHLYPLSYLSSLPYLETEFLIVSEITKETRLAGH